MAERRDLINAGVLIGIAASVVAAIATTTRTLGPHKVVTHERERCYGVSRAGANDCANGVHSCANQSKQDAEPDEWLMVPKGTCVRLRGSMASNDVAVPASKPVNNE